MNDINAVIGIQNFASIKKIVHGHRTNGMLYDAALGSVDGVTLLQKPEKCLSSYWIYTLRVDRRDDFVKKLQSEGIACSRVHDRNDKHACLSEYRIPLPGTDEVCSDMICIPCGWWVKPGEIDHIVNVIRAGW